MSSDCWTSNTESILSASLGKWKHTAHDLNDELPNVASEWGIKWHHVWVTKQTALKLPLKTADGITGAPSETRCHKRLSSPFEHLSILHWTPQQVMNQEMCYIFRSFQGVTEVISHYAIRSTAVRSTSGQDPRREHHGLHRQPVLGQVDHHHTVV